MKPDHDEAKKWATFADETIGPTSAYERNNARAYLDAMARLDKATELLARSLDVFEEANIWGTLNDDISAFLERKTDDKQS